MGGWNKQSKGGMEEKEGKKVKRQKEKKRGRKPESEEKETIHFRRPKGIKGWREVRRSEKVK